MNKFAVFAVCCLLLQVTSAAPRSEFLRLLDRYLKKELNDQKIVKAYSRYSTTQIVQLGISETVQLRGALCQNTQYQAVHVRMNLLQNPTWDPFRGIVKYNVTSGDSGQVLCTNQKADCYIDSWPGEDSNIVIHATADAVAGTEFILHADFSDWDSEKAQLIKANYLLPPVDVRFLQSPLLKADTAPTKLIQSLMPDSNLQLENGQNLQIQLPWCPTLDKVTFVSTVTSIDGEGAFTQYVCDTPDCTPLTAKYGNYDGRPLVVNTVEARFPEGGFEFYVAVECWGGSLDKTSGKYMCEFAYNAIDASGQ